MEVVRQTAYTWRCFGDGIAYVYLDKHALKHTFFQTESINPKQGAGFLLDKKGLPYEIATLESALDAGIPAVLADLTNTIRHGDVCLMGTSDPYLIEVKATGNVDSRGKQQQRRLSKLHDFFETDRAEGLRGFDKIRRKESSWPERTYVEELNSDIRDARGRGSALICPEPGLVYIIVTDMNCNKIPELEDVQLKSPWIFDLNEYKSMQNWAPYQPFVLTIADKNDLWDFIRGDLYILGIIDTDVLCELARAQGLDATFNGEDSEYPLRITSGEFKGAGVSAAMLGRAALECVSLE